MHIWECLQNDTHKIIQDFKTQTDNLISSRWSELVSVSNYHPEDFVIPAEGRLRKEAKKRTNSLDLVGEMKKASNMKAMVIPIVIGALGLVLTDLQKKMMELKIRP